MALDTPPPGTRQTLAELGPERFAKWMLEQERVLITDTTMRDAHQSLLATRMRTIDLTTIAPYYRALKDFLAGTLPGQGGVISG